MVFVAYGLNHKTAPLELREKIAPNAEQQQQLLLNLVSNSSTSEAGMLATCNRTEIYCSTNDTSCLLPWLSSQYDIKMDILKSYSYLHQGDEGIRHTMRVACGLDSMMLGEPQILGQMKKAYKQACDIGTIKHELRPIFNHVFSASKKVRSRTDIGVNPISIAFAAVNLIRRNFNDVSQLNIMIIGAGDTARLVAKYLQQQGARHFFIANRTLKHAANLAEVLAGTSISISEIADYLPKTDIVITATACPLPFIGKELVQQALVNSQRALFMLDLAMPRDIEAEVAELPGVCLYNLDHLHQIVTTGLNERQDAARVAEQIIEVEIENYCRWQRTRNAATTIRHYRDRMQQLTDNELERAKRLLQLGQDPVTIVTQLSQRLLDKLIHEPTVRIRHTSSDERSDVLKLINKLYADI